MGFLDDVNAAMPYKGPRCTVCALLDAADDEFAAEVEAAMADTALYATAIGKALRARGHDIHHEAVRRHRNGTCRGGRDAR